MNTTIDTVEELINTLNPNVLQCDKCNKWFPKGEFDCNHIRIYSMCSKCYRKIHPIT